MARKTLVSFWDTAHLLGSKLSIFDGGHFGVVIYLYQAFWRSKLDFLSAIDMMVVSSSGAQ